MRLRCRKFCNARRLNGKTVSTRLLTLKTQHVCIHIALMQFNVNYRIMIRNVKLWMAHNSSKNKYRFVPYSWAVWQTVSSLFSSATWPPQAWQNWSPCYFPGNSPPSVTLPTNMTLDGSSTLTSGACNTHLTDHSSSFVASGVLFSDSSEPFVLSNLISSKS